MTNNLWKEIKPRDPQPPWFYSYKGELVTEKQFENYKGIYSENIADTLSYFKNFPLSNKVVFT